MNFANLRIHVQLKRQKRFRRSCSAAARQLVAINPAGNKVMKFMFRKYRHKFYTLNRDFFYRDSFVPLLHTWREIMPYRYNFQRIGSIFPLRERLRSSQSIFEAACFRVFPRVEPRARYPVEFVIEWKHDVYAVIQIDWTSANYTMIRWHGPRARGEKLHALPMKYRAFEQEIGSMPQRDPRRIFLTVDSRSRLFFSLASLNPSVAKIWRVQTERHPEIYDRRGAGIVDETQSSRVEAGGIYSAARDVDKYLRARGSKSESACTNRTKRRLNIHK